MLFSLKSIRTFTKFLINTFVNTAIIFTVKTTITPVIRRCSLIWFIIFTLNNFIIESINNIVDLPNQTVNIFLVEEGEEDMHTFEIINVSNNKSFLISTEFINDINRREMLTAIVAGAIKKINVQVTYMMELSYEDLEETI